MLQPLDALDERTWLRMIRYGLRTGADCLILRPGHRPLVDGLGGAREVAFRQIAVDDVRAAAGFALARVNVPARVHALPGEAARPLTPFFELPGEALCEARFEPCAGGFALALDLIRPVPAEIELDTIEL